MMNTETNDDEARPLTVKEAGRKGGSTTSRRHGREHYQTIGKKGGQRVKELVERARALSETSDRAS